MGGGQQNPGPASANAEVCPRCQTPAQVREIPKPAFAGGGVYAFRVPGCDCAKRERERRAHQRTAAERQRLLDRLFAQAHLDARFEQARFDNFERVPGTEFALERCKDLLENWEAWSADGRGLLIVGDNGCGKTHLAAACVHALIRKAVTALFVTVPDYLERLRQSYRNPRIEEHWPIRPEEAALEVGLLVLDDLGTERLPADERGDWARDRLYLLVDRRYRAKLPLLVTTNSSDEELLDRLGMRIYRRLNEILEAVPITAGDYADWRRAA